MNWLKEFGKKFDQATENHPKMRRVLSLASIEQAVKSCPHYINGRISRDIVKVVFDEQAWPYNEWWRDLSDRLPGPIKVGHEFDLPEAKQKAVNKLHRYLEDIGVVSVILRFWCPEEFGIISPPVEWILSLVPSRHPVENYLNYLQNLNDLRKQYGFERLADVDMALWSSAHLFTGERELAEQMHNDKYFEQVRLANLLRGLGQSWQGTLLQQFNLSKSLLKHDHFTAALMASRPFEWAVAEIATKHYRVPKWTRSSQCKTALDYYIRQLAKEPQFLGEFGGTITISDEVESERRLEWETTGTMSTRLNVLRKIRNSAVHYDEVTREHALKPKEVSEFISNIDNMLKRLS